MAQPAIGYTLSTILLTITVVVPGVPGSSVTCHSSATVIQSPSHIQFGTLPAGYIAHYDIGVAYKVHRQGATWKEARERCISEGAQLAVIDTFIKFEFLVNQTRKTDYIWVGIHSMYDDTEWVSVSTGSTLTNLPWAPSEPNSVYDCVAAGVWMKRGLRNYKCNQRGFYYVCEVPIPENSNGCKDYPMAEISIN